MTPVDARSESVEAAVFEGAAPQRAVLDVDVLVIGWGKGGKTLAVALGEQGRSVALVERSAEMIGGSCINIACVPTKDLVQDSDAAASVIATVGDESQHFTADAVLVAAGRRPALDDLDPGAGGIVLDDRGFIAVDERLRTNVPDVYAVGDVNGGPQFTYVSLDDHRVVLSQLAGDGARSIADRVAVPSTIFLTPPLARVGLNRTQAREQGRPVLVASKRVADIAAMPRPKIVGETHGLITVLVDPATDLVLGATVFCVDAQEVINLIALAMRGGVTASALRDGIWTHPSSTEALNEVLGELRPLH